MARVRREAPATDASAPRADVPDAGHAALLAALDEPSLGAAAASTGVLARGRTYAASGAVRELEPLSGDVPGVRAHVVGTDDYVAEVRVERGRLRGDCSCPHGADGWFCKHQVAVALLWRAQLGGAAAPYDEAAAAKVRASAKRAETARQRARELVEFVTAQPANVLAERLLELAERDPQIRRELQQWHRVATAKTDPVELRRTIGEILATHAQFLRWDQSGAFVRQAEPVIALLQAARTRDAVTAVDLCAYALRRAWKVLERADDSNGEIGGLCRAIGQEFVAALQAASSLPPKFPETYAQLLVEDPFGTFDEGAALAAFDDATLESVRAAIAARWRAAKDALRAAEERASGARGTKRRGARASEAGAESLRWDLRRLERLHLEQLEAQGEVDGVLAVLREDLTTPERCSAYTAALERHGRTREAFVHAERAHRQFPRDLRLEDDVLRMYERDGWHDEALRIRRRRFEERPGVEAWRALFQAARAAGRDLAALRSELYSWLEERESAALRAPNPYARLQPRLAGRRNVSERAAFLCADGEWEAALALVQPPHVCDPSVLEWIARGLAPGRVPERIALLQRVFESSMANATAPYRDPLRMVAEIGALMDDAARSAWLAKLRVEYRAKRNFVRGLPAG